MKTKHFALIAALAVFFTMNTRANGDAADATADLLVFRPAGFVMTVLGSALFVAALPVSAPTGSMKKLGHLFVVQPAKATFQRPIGDFDDEPCHCEQK